MSWRSNTKVKEATSEGLNMTKIEGNLSGSRLLRLPANWKSRTRKAIWDFLTISTQAGKCPPLTEAVSPFLCPYLYL